MMVVCMCLELVFQSHRANVVKKPKAAEVVYLGRKVSTYLTINSKCQQHKEEQDSPNGSCGELGNGVGIHNEGQ